MARAASGRLTQKTFVSLAALAVGVASSLTSEDAHAQSRGLLASSDPLSAPLLAQQGQPAGDGAGPAQAPPGNTAGGTPGGPSITVGGSTAAGATLGQQNQAPKDEPGAEKKASGMSIYDRIAGTALFMQTGATIGTFFKGYQADYNPTVATYASFAPRFALSKDWQLRGLIAGNLEYTNSDTTTRQQEFELYDANVQLFYRGVPALGGKVKLFPFVGVGLPTSKGSRARTMRLTPSAGLQAAMPIEHFAGGEAVIIGRFSYGRPIYGQTTPRAELPYQRSCLGGNDCGSQLSGTMNARDTFTTLAIFAVTWGNWSPGAFMLLNNQIAYSPARSGVNDVRQGNGQKPTTARASTYFALWLDYQATDWLTPEIGYQQQRSALAADGQYGNPFFSNKQDQVLYLGANVQIDSLLKKLTGEEAKAGIVRAKNGPATTPIRFY